MARDITPATGRLSLPPPHRRHYHRPADESHTVAMDTFTKIQYILLCLVVPAAWGLLVEWFFHVNRGRRGARRDIAETASPAPPAGPRGDAS